MPHLPRNTRNSGSTDRIPRHGRRDLTMNTKTNTAVKPGTTNTAGGATTVRRRQPGAGVGRLVRRLERERRSWARRPDHDAAVVPTEVAWRAGVAEGLRLAQLAIRKGV
jgi:hypothetical protein